MKRGIFIEIACMLLITVFLYTALSKWLNFHDFKEQMDNQPFDNKYTPLLVYALPAIELIIALMLMIPRVRLAGLYAYAVMMAVFTTYVALVTLHYYDRVPCSCGGVIKQLSWPQHLVLNIFLLGLSIAGIVVLKAKHLTVSDNRKLVKV